MPPYSPLPVNQYLKDAAIGAHSVSQAGFLERWPLCDR
jgi:hypothetical protein